MDLQRGDNNSMAKHVVAFLANFSYLSTNIHAFQNVMSCTNKLRLPTRTIFRRFMGYYDHHCGTKPKNLPVLIRMG